MRETLAKVGAAALTGMVVALAAFFAHRRNVAEGQVVAPQTVEARWAAPDTDPALVSRGRAVYEAQSCSRCHAVAGRGNPRIPLDGVGARHPAGQLEDWITAEGAAARQLSGSARRVKEEFRSLPRGEMEALVAYLSDLR